MFDVPGRLAIPAVRGLRTPKVLLVLAVAAGFAACAVAPASAQTTPGTTPPAPASAPTAATETSSGATPGTYGPPAWLPLRADLDGSTIIVGCTYQSHGSAFGYECSGHHDRWAIDFLASAGTPVHSAGKGFATDLTGRPGGGGFGNVVQVDHGNGDITLYGHLTEVLLPPGGAWVDEDTTIGTVGSTGSSSADHLHYERRNLALDASIDPGPLLACRGGLAIRYPEAGGAPSWKGLSWGAMTVISEGTDCADDAGEQKPPPGAKTSYGARTPVERRVPTAWDRLLPRRDPLEAALDRLLTPTR